MIYMVFVPKTDITEEAFEQNILKSMYLYMFLYDSFGIMYKLIFVPAKVTTESVC